MPSDRTDDMSTGSVEIPTDTVTVDFDRYEVTVDQYVQIYSKTRTEAKYHPEEVLPFKDDFTKFVFTGFKDHKRQYA